MLRVELPPFSFKFDEKSLNLFLILSEEILEFYKNNNKGGGKVGKKNKGWIQQAFGKNKGALHRQLRIPENKKIPVTLLEEIMDAEIGETIINPTKTGKRKIKVTKLLKQRANPVLTVRRLKKK